MKIEFYFWFKNSIKITRELKVSEEKVETIVDEFRNKTKIWFNWTDRCRFSYYDFYFDATELLACSFKVIGKGVD